MAIIKVKTDVAGAVWKFLVVVGDQVSEGDQVAILESMKMEIPVLSPSDGTVKELTVKEGDVCNEEETVMILEV